MTRVNDDVVSDLNDDILDIYDNSRCKTSDTRY